MTKRLSSVSIETWDEERVALRIQLQLHEDGILNEADLSAMQVRIRELDRLINEERGRIRAKT